MKAGTRTTILMLGTAQFIMVLDTTVMNVSISQVVADLNTSVTQLQAAITAYALVMAAFMLTGAKLGDIWGRRRVFAIGLGVYGLGSLITESSRKNDRVDAEMLARLARVDPKLLRPIRHRGEEAQLDLMTIRARQNEHDAAAARRSS